MAAGSLREGETGRENGGQAVAEESTSLLSLTMLYLGETGNTSKGSDEFALTC